MKMTWQPSKIKRKRKIGYRARKATKGGRKVLASRRAKGRKRLMREAFRLLVKEGRMPACTEWVFIGRSALRGKKVQDVVEDIAALCARLPGDAKPNAR